MKVRQLTIPGDGLLRIRVISWEEGEVSRIQSHRTAVPDLYWDDTPERKLLRRYRIKQVMDDGTESPWVVQRRVVIKAGFGQTVRTRIRPVSITGQVGHWQQASITTGKDEREPGQGLLEAFVSDLIDLVIDSFVDQIFLSVSAQDQASHHAFDDFPSYDAFASYLESLPQDDIEIVLESIRDLSKQLFREHVSSLHLADRPLPWLLLYAPSDRWVRQAVYSASTFLLEILAHDAWESALKEVISAHTDDGRIGAVHDRYDEAIEHGVSFFSEFLRRDQLALQAIDAIGSYVFPTLLGLLPLQLEDVMSVEPISDRIVFGDSIPMGFIDVIGAVGTLKRILSSERLLAEINPRGLWTVRPHLIDLILLPILEHLRGPEVGIKFADDFVSADYETIQAILDDPSGWVADRFKLSIEEENAVFLSPEKSDIAQFFPEGDPYFSHIIFAKEFLHRLLGFQVAARLLYSDIPKSFRENFPISLVLEPALRQSSFLLRDTAHISPESDSSHWLRISSAPLYAGILERIIEDVSAVLDPEFGSSTAAFIMGQFIMGVTPMGRT